MDTARPEDSDDLRDRIVAAAAALIASGGRDAATTRAVADAARVQAPTIYRLFKDKDGLLDIVAERVFARYVADKAARRPQADPVRALRDGWDAHVAFGLAHPAVFAIIHLDPRHGTSSPAAATGLAALRGRIDAIARAGRLRVGEERATALVHAACVGTVLTLLGRSEERRDPKLSALAREAALAAITGEAAPFRSGPAGAASALRASLRDAAPLTPGERHLLGELLDRIVEADQE